MHADGCRWRLADSERAFRRTYPDEPRNWYARDEAATRAAWGERAEEVLSTTPENSNDFWLAACANDLAAVAPAELREQIEGIFVARTPSREVNAEAWMPAKSEHLVGVYEGTTVVLLAYAAIMRRCYHLMASSRGRGFKTIGEASTAFLEEMKDLLSDPLVAALTAQRAVWAGGSTVEIEERVAELLNEFDERLPSGAVSIRELLDVADHFVLAHEFGHHLLGHTYAQPWGPCQFPARSLLVAARGTLGVSLGDGWSERQEEELDADAFGFLLLAGWFTEEPSDRTRWYAAIFGALLALPVLEDLAAGSRVSAGLGLAAPEYPPLETRVGQIVHLINAYPESLTDDDEHHPAGLLQQMLLFQSFLIESRSSSRRAG
jgi:hypothetical protein